MLQNVRKNYNGGKMTPLPTSWEMHKITAIKIMFLGCHRDCVLTGQMQILTIAKQYSLLHQPDLITLGKQQHAWSGGWNEWWKQRQAFTYANATLT